jgi:hypothetical protein
MKAQAVHLRRGELISTCGHKTRNLTEDQSAVTCKSCLKQIQIAGRPQREQKMLAAISPTSSFYTKIAGVTFMNDDGSWRQEVITRCRIGKALKLVRNPEDEFDPAAVKVMRVNGEQLGHVPAHVSRGGDPSGLADRMDGGQEYQCRISEITGGGPGDELRCEYRD